MQTLIIRKTSLTIDHSRSCNGVLMINSRLKSRLNHILDRSIKAYTSIYKLNIPLKKINLSMKSNNTEKNVSRVQNKIGVNQVKYSKCEHKCEIVRF